MQHTPALAAMAKEFSIIGRRIKSAMRVGAALGSSTFLRAYANLLTLLRQLTLTNSFNTHPPSKMEMLNPDAVARLEAKDGYTVAFDTNA